MRSFRAQVTLWIAAVVTLALLVLGTAMSVVNLNQLSAGMDRDLQNRARSMIGPGPPPDGGFMGGPGSGGFGQGGPGQGGPGQGGPGQGGPGQGGPGQGGVFIRQPPIRPGMDDDVIASIRRPRVIMIQEPGGGQNLPRQDQLFDPEAFNRALAKKPGFSETTFRGERIRVYSMPAIRDGEVVAGIQVAAELRPLDQLKAAEIRTMLATFPFAILGAIFVAYFLAGRVMKPIGEMGTAAKSIAEGDYTARLPAQGMDEFGALGNQFNQMAEKVEESVTGLKASLEQQRQFTADASHELRTPLTRLRLATSAGLSGPDSDIREQLRVADDAGKDMSKLVQQLLDLARADTGDLSRRFEPVDLRVVASEAVSKVHSEVPIELDLAEAAVTIPGDPHHLERVFLNLLENAIRHTPSGTIKVRVHPTFIEVSDTGTGIDPQHLPHVKERFYRVDAARDRGAGGAGLGLAIVDEVVRAHGGHLEITSVAGQGTTVRATFA